MVIFFNELFYCGNIRNFVRFYCISAEAAFNTQGGQMCANERHNALGGRIAKTCNGNCKEPLGGEIGEKPPLAGAQAE
jgi:hypothetical protein